MIRSLALGLGALLAGAFLGPAAGAAATVTRGIDVSRFDGRIDWGRAAGSGISFAFVQASRGSGSDCTVKPERCGFDRHYETNRRQARAAGVRVGAYHRAFVNGPSLESARRDARHEALVFAREVGVLRSGDLLPVLDFEAPFDDLTPRRLRAWAHTWLDTVEAELGARPMIYTNDSSWSETGDRGAFARAGYKLWVANWHVSSPLVPAGNWAGRGWAVWQYASDGHVPGIEGTTDLDRLGVPFGSVSVP